MLPKYSVPGFMGMETWSRPALFRSRRIQWLSRRPATRSCIMTSGKARAALIVGANLVVLVAVAPAFAGEESAWDGTARAAVRLIAGAPRGEGAATIQRAGI